MPSPSHPVASVHDRARLCVNPAFPAEPDAPSRTVAHTQTALLPPYLTRVAMAQSSPGNRQPVTGAIAGTEDFRRVVAAQDPESDRVACWSRASREIAEVSMAGAPLQRLQRLIPDTSGHTTKANRLAARC